MKQITLFINLLLLSTVMSAQSTNHKGALVYQGEDVVFHQIDEHTWVGNGHLLYNESVYIVEGSDRAMLIDAGTTIKDLDKIVASITSKPVTLYATHAHSDHTGMAVKYFDEIHLNMADSDMFKQMHKDYKGQMIPLQDGEKIDLGGRTIEVVFTPGHTSGSVTFIDAKAGYGFSGDAFGSTNLLLFTYFSSFIDSCKKMLDVMQKKQITILYPGHYSGDNPETIKRVQDMLKVSEGVLSGELKGERQGSNWIIKGDGFQIQYDKSGIK